MFGLEWMYRGSMWRAIALTIIWIALVMPPVLLGLYYGFQKPMEERWDKIKADNQAKIKAELTSINNMNCQQLHDKLLSSDHFYDSDNEAIARDHYVAQCGVRLP